MTERPVTQKHLHARKGVCMVCASKKFRLILIAIFLFSCCYRAAASEPSSSTNISLIEVTPNVMEYASGIIKPVISSLPKKDKLSVLLKVSEVLRDPLLGIGTNTIAPGNFIIYDKLNTIKLGFLITFKLSSEQKNILKSWHSRYMQSDPADVFFAPSADEIVITKAAFGCSHYARVFVAVVKALGLIAEPTDLRYVISSKSDDYNEALEEMDKKMTINGHQFVMAKVDSRWVAINTSKSEYSLMPENFSPSDVSFPNNIPIQFASYPDVTFLLRKIGKDFNDDCDDNSLASLMNISRSGDPQVSSFRWNKFTPTIK